MEALFVNPFLANFPNLNPLKTQKIFGFVVFSGGIIKWEHLLEIMNKLSTLFPSKEINFQSYCKDTITSYEFTQS